MDLGLDTLQNVPDEFKSHNGGGLRTSQKDFSQPGSPNIVLISDLKSRALVNDLLKVNKVVSNTL